MKTMKDVLRSVLASLLAVSFFSTTEAGKADHYINLVRNGKYCIVCHIDSRFNNNDNQNHRERRTVVLLKDKEQGIQYFSTYQHGYGSKYYFMSQLLRCRNQLYGRCHGANKEIDIATEQVKDLKKISESHYTYWPYYEMPRNQAVSALFSCLAEITEKNQVLKNYKAEYRKSGVFSHNGTDYLFDEYLITSPAQAVLQIFYQNGTMVRCVKLVDDKIVSHPILFAENTKEDRMVTVSFDRFDDDTEALVKTLLTKIPKHDK